MIGSVVAFLWGLFTAALKFAFLILGILVKFLAVVIGILLLIIFLWRRRNRS